MRSVGRFYFLMALTAACGTSEPEFQPYLGQEQPGDTPVLFAPGIVSVEGRRDLNSIFTPDGQEFYFSIADSAGATVMVMKWDGSVWTEPEAAEFTSGFGEVDPFLAPDGSRMFYGSRAPREGDTPEDNWQIWAVDREGDGWGNPWALGEAVNSGERQIYPSVASDGTLYFQSRREGALGGSDIYFSTLVDGEYQPAENVGAPVSSEFSEGDVFVAPDHSYLIFVSSGRPDGFGEGDLYISFRNQDGTWAEPTNLGETINTERVDYCPVLSPDGEFFFYSSGPDVYWMRADFIDRLRPE